MDQIESMRPASAPAADVRDTRPPVLLVAMGRQRVGKTSFLNALTEYVRARGGQPEVWNIDSQNTAHTLSAFHADTREPEETKAAEQALWLDRQMEHQKRERCDVVLDVGGGWTPFNTLTNGGDAHLAIEEDGVSLVAIYLLGPDEGDISYLDMMQNRHMLRPERSLIIFNEGLISDGRSARSAFAPIRAHPVVTDAIERGTLVSFLPALQDMPKLAERRQSFAAFIGREEAAGFVPSSSFERLRVRRWWEREFPEFLRMIPAGYLPRLPAGVSY
jgi:hypothetical protein